MYWLLTYSQKGATGNTIVANTTVMDISPANWLSVMLKKYPQENTILLYSIEMSRSEHQALREQL